MCNTSCVMMCRHGRSLFGWLLHCMIAFILRPEQVFNSVKHFLMVLHSHVQQNVSAFVLAASTAPLRLVVWQTGFGTSTKRTSLHYLLFPVTKHTRIARSAIDFTTFSKICFYHLIHCPRECPGNWHVCSDQECIQTTHVTDMGCIIQLMFLPTVLETPWLHHTGSHTQYSTLSLLPQATSHDTINPFVRSVHAVEAKVSSQSQPLMQSITTLRKTFPWARKQVNLLSSLLLP